MHDIDHDMTLVDDHDLELLSGGDCGCMSTAGQFGAWLYGTLKEIGHNLAVAAENGVVVGGL